MSAVTELEALREKVEVAQRRVREVTEAQKAAVHELKAARAHLAQVEADGTTKEVEAARRRLEAARQGVEIAPWPERRRIAQSHVGRAQSAVTSFVRGHFVELLEAKEAQGQAAAATMLSATETVITANAERHRIAGEISALWRLVASPQPRDVEYVRAEKLVSEAGVLLEQAADAGANGCQSRRGR